MDWIGFYFLYFERWTPVNADAISKGKKLPSTERYAVILYLYRNGSKNMKEINEDLPGSTEILREMSFDFRVRSIDQVVEKLIEEYQKSHSVEAPA